MAGLLGELLEGGYVVGLFGEQLDGWSQWGGWGSERGRELSGRGTSVELLSKPLEGVRSAGGGATGRGGGVASGRGGIWSRDGEIKAIIARRRRRASGGGKAVEWHRDLSEAAGSRAWIRTGDWPSGR